MKKITLSILSLLFAVGATAQPDALLTKYRSMALDYNHDLKAAGKNIAASIEVEKSARADLKPKLSAGANFQYTGNPMELTLDLPSLGAPMTFQGTDLRYGASVSLLQPIYTGGLILESIRLAEHQQSLATNQQEAIRSAICYQTDVQYWSTVARHELVAVATEFRNSIASFTQTIRERVDIGLADPQDLLMAEVKLNEADYQLLQAQNNFATGRMALNSLIGVELESPTEVESVLPLVSPIPTLAGLDGGNRPELKIAQDRIKIAQSALKLGDAKYRPQFYVGLDGSYSTPGYNFNKDLDPNYAVYAKLSIPLWEWGKRRSDKRASAFKVGMATDDLHRVADNVNLEVQTARLSLTQALERVRLSESSLGKANENESKALERYAEGKTSIVDVIEAQTYRQTAQVNYVQAKVSAQGHYAELIKALNGYSI